MSTPDVELAIVAKALARGDSLERGHLRLIDANRLNASQMEALRAALESRGDELHKLDADVLADALRQQYAAATGDDSAPTPTYFQNISPPDRGQGARPGEVDWAELSSADFADALNRLG